MATIDTSIDEGVRVLHLDPDKKAFETLSGFLTYWFGDYVNVRWTDSVEQAIDELNSDRIDILITEVVLPGQGDPTVFIDRLMDEPGAADSPVVVYSSLKEDMFGVYAFRAGVAEFFPKHKTNSYLLQYRLRNLFRMQFRTKLLYHQIDDALRRFQTAHGDTQSGIKDLNDLVHEMRGELEKEYESRNKLEEEKKKIQSVFGMYVDPAIVQGIMKGDIALEQKGVEQEVSVLFADIRGYTSMAEQLDPEKVISFLNEYFTSMT
ncbi:MAG: adenylate/guanylate cyclase domain-containing response regulator, partial [Leptospiraceae bacterium]|nr:adenylate/guanylate cyclase domain-containing response regulator [Leptospiraceae bacterium]